MMSGVEPDPGHRFRGPTALDEQAIERGIEGTQGGKPGECLAGTPANEGRRGQHGGDGTGTVSPAEVQGRARGAVLQEKLGPGDTPTGEISFDHGAERPCLEMRALDRRIEDDPTSGGDHTAAQLDVFDG
jgi:hypothetical protein